MERIERNSIRFEIAKNIIGITAVFITGFWGYFTFFAKDAGALVPDIEQSVAIQPLDWVIPKKSSIDLSMKIKNIGTCEFTIDKIEIYYWIIDNDMVFGKRYFDYDSIEKNVPATDSLPVHQNATLIQEYKKDQEHHKHFVFTFDSSASKSIIFKAYSVGHYKNLSNPNNVCTASSSAWAYDILKKNPQKEKTDSTHSNL